ncbi:hypothetical protein AOLI_G00232630 [Acnodon oligacanthus]
MCCIWLSERTSVQLDQGPRAGLGTAAELCLSGLRAASSPAGDPRQLLAVIGVLVPAGNRPRCFSFSPRERRWAAALKLRDRPLLSVCCTPAGLAGSLCSDPTFSLSSVDSTGPRVKMSCVKEECEDVSVMEASGLKTEDEMKEEPLFQDTEEECKPDVKPFPEEYSAPISDLNTEQETSFSAADVSHLKEHRHQLDIRAPVNRPMSVSEQETHQTGSAPPEFPTPDLKSGIPGTQENRVQQLVIGSERKCTNLPRLHLLYTVFNMVVLQRTAD